MPKNAFFSSALATKLFVLSITLVLIGCSANSPAPVLDKSRANIKRPQAHIVIPGDTLFSIAWRYGLKYEKLAEHNGIKAPYIIRPTQVIRLDVAGTELPLVIPPPAKTGAHSHSSSIKPISPSGSTRNGSSQKKQTPIGRNNLKAEQSWGAPEWRWPVTGPLLSSFQSNSGLNKGIDIGGKLGEPVLAAASGKVVYSGSGLRGYGKLLIVKHNETFLSAYAHNSVLRVKEGDIVKAGQVIAEMGSTGTDRVKLHFEIRRDGTPVDPLRFLPKR